MRSCNPISDWRNSSCMLDSAVQLKTSSPSSIRWFLAVDKSGNLVVISSTRPENTVYTLRLETSAEELTGADTASWISTLKSAYRQSTFQLARSAGVGRMYSLLNQDREPPATSSK
jgi:hypothetical protein